MGVQYCAECKDAMIASDAQLTDYGAFLCPKCSDLLKDLGSEEVALSELETFLEYDKKPHKNNPYDKNSLVTYESATVDLEILECEDAIKHKSDNIDALMHLAKLHRSKGNYIAAKDAFLKITKRDEANIEARKLLAEIFFYKESPKKAVEQLLKMMDLEPGNELYPYNIAVVYLKAKKYKAVKYFLRKAYKISKDETFKVKVKRFILRNNSSI